MKNQFRKKDRLPHHGRGGAQHVGRMRIRLAKMLNQCFPNWDVQPHEIQPATGANRTNRMLDIYAWELFTRTKSGVPVVYGSFDTITECVKQGGCHLKHGELHAGVKRETLPGIEE